MNYSIDVQYYFCRYSLPLFNAIFQGLPTDCWRISKVNENYSLSDTYPPLVNLFVSLYRNIHGTFLSKVFVNVYSTTYRFD
jgi:hypothetical protein